MHQGLLTNVYFRAPALFSGQEVLPATRTCLTQAEARASNTFYYPILGVESRSKTDRADRADRPDRADRADRADRHNRTTPFPPKTPPLGGAAERPDTTSWVV